MVRGSSFHVVGEIDALPCLALVERHGGMNIKSHTTGLIVFLHVRHGERMDLALATHHFANRAFSIIVGFDVSRLVLAVGVSLLAMA